MTIEQGVEAESKINTLNADILNSLGFDSSFVADDIITMIKRSDGDSDQWDGILSEVIQGSSDNMGLAETLGYQIIAEEKLSDFNFAMINTIQKTDLVKFQERYTDGAKIKIIICGLTEIQQIEIKYQNEADYYIYILIN
ncbi:MAG TPA: hypothetical protein VHA74_02775 [Candidatus Dojkabacteria bacterium]|nr:hypothetical protein [Candidatus Dojkabacteria bacterium]